MAQTLFRTLPAQSAGGAANKLPLGTINSTSGSNSYISKVTLHPTATIAADASNNVAIALVVYRAAASLFTYGTYTTTTALTADTPATITASATQAQLSSLQAGDALVVTCTQGGTGVAIVVDKLAIQVDVS